MAERHGDLGRWIRLSADYAWDPRIMRIRPAAELLYLRTLAASRAHESDGHVAREWLAALTRGFDARTAQRAVNDLVSEGLWEPCDDGWRVPYERWARWQDTNDDRAAQRENERKRKAAWRARKALEGENG